MRISIITLALDLPPYIDEAIASVPRADGVEIEHIIIHDGSDADFAELGRRFPALRLLRGAGRGATPAANEALKHATGDFVFFLNADDCMGPDSMSALAVGVRRAPQIEIWTGQTVLFTVDDHGAETVLRTVADASLTALTLGNVLDDYPLLSARFISRAVYERFSGLDEYFHTCSDREFMIRLTMAGVREAPLNALVSRLRLHDDSATIHSQGSAVPQYFGQHVRLARRWMAEPGIADEQRTAFKDWHARELLRLTFYMVKAGHVVRAVAVALSGLAVDPLWAWRARTIRAARRLRRRTDEEVVAA